MTIRRQYSLPNCTLILEGLSDNPVDSGSNTGLMSILVNAECHFLNSNQLLSGGRVFLESLVKSVSTYAQGFISGLNHPQSASEANGIVHIEKVSDRNLHRITLDPEPSTDSTADSSGDRQPVTVELTTVQFFDLVEAIDQLFADNRTLPDLVLKLQPLGKRYRQAEEPFVQRATPAALGVAGLAAFAVVFSLIPPPAIRKPELKPQVSPTQTIPRQTPASSPTQTPATP
jgi:Domain of unknown function (DUF4335)